MGLAQRELMGVVKRRLGKKKKEHFNLFFQRTSRTQTCLKNLLFLSTLDTKFILPLYQVNTKEVTFQITKENGRKIDQANS